jgi:lipopolysaccharide biosynthesis glycosyltransferase
MESLDSKATGLVKACVCYTINEGYLLPALVSALQARRHLDPEQADVVLLVFGARGAASEAAEGVAAKHSIRMIHVEPAGIDDMHIMFARLFLDRLLPTQYQRVVYIDGDTQVRGDLGPLINAPIAVGHFLACRDPAAIFARLSEGWRRRIVEQRMAVGYARAYSDYFNSGVLVVDRASWGDLSRACIDLIREKGGRSRYPDQDILNLAVGHRCTLISNRWNFPGFFIGSPRERAVKPCIYHFMSEPRPWNEAVKPWGAVWSRPYVELIENNPELSLLARKRNGLRSLRYRMQQELKMLVEYSPAGRLLEHEAEFTL